MVTVVVGGGASVGPPMAAVHFVYGCPRGPWPNTSRIDGRSDCGQPLPACSGICEREPRTLILFSAKMFVRIRLHFVLLFYG